MITRKHKTALLGIIGIVVSFVSSPAFAGPNVYKGRLGIIDIDNGSAIYSGPPNGTEFSIEIDLVTGLGIVSDGTTVTSFTAFLVNGSFFQVSNNEIVDADGAAQINFFAGTNLVAGDTVDLIGIVGEGPTPSGGIIEIEVLYVLDPLTFDDVSPNNYPPNPDDIITTIFNVEERDNQAADIFDAFGAVDFDSILSPLCDFQMNQLTYVDGETVTADTFRFANLSSGPMATEMKIWLGVTGIPPISVTNAGADGSVVFPAGMDVDYGPLPLFPVTGLPLGEYELSCRILDPVTGELLWEDLNTFDIQ